MDFLSQWLQRFRLTASNWRSETARHTATLPFIAQEYSIPLLKFLFAEAPDIVAKQGDAGTALLADAYGWCCFAFWQCESAFPWFPESYAFYLRTALSAPVASRDPSAVLLARIIAEWNAENGRCGFNRFQLSNPEVIRNSERLNREGGYEIYLKAQEKYDEYVFYLEQSPEFVHEWAAIKAAFPKQCAGGGIIRRSLIPERNWQQGPGAEFIGKQSQFQAVFDLFCWKYYLWGMEDDEPLLLKTSAVVTPFGTQIFIPGYLSFDPRRDLNLPAIGRLHRARGVSRQGPRYADARRADAELESKAQAADAKARKLGHKGADRYRYICDELGWSKTVFDSNFRKIRRLLAAAKRKKKSDQA